MPAHISASPLAALSPTQPGRIQEALIFSRCSSQMSVFESTSRLLTDSHDAIGNMSVNFRSRVLFLCSLDEVLTAGRSNWLSAQYSRSSVTVVATLLCLLRSSKPSWLPGEEDFGSVSQFHSSFDLNLPVVYPRAHLITAVLIQIQPFRFSIKVLSCKQLETAGFSGREHNTALIPVTTPL